MVVITISGCSTTDVKNENVQASSSNASPPAITAPSQGPALWKLQDDDTTIYIFGTADLLPPDANWQSQNVQRAIAQSDRFLLETNESPETQAQLGPIIQQFGLYQDGRTLRSALSQEQIAEINAVTTQLGAPLAALDPLKPWLASIQIGALHGARQGYQTWTSGLASLLVTINSLDKPSQFIEPNRGTILKIFSEMPEDIQIKMLTTITRQVRDTPNLPERVSSLWLKGDLENLTPLYHGEGRWAGPQLYQTLLVDRNIAWSKKIEKIAAEEEGVIFVAIGTGHVLGADSLIKMIENRGFKISRL